MKRFLALAALAALPLNALADDSGSQAQYYFSAGGGAFGPAFSVGAGNQVDAIELDGIDLGKVNGGKARFAGISLVQFSTPKHGFNFLFRLGLGRETTTFPDGSTGHRMWFGNVYVGLGVQYIPTPHFALRAEVNRIGYTSTQDGVSGGYRYPATLSAVVLF